MTTIKILKPLSVVFFALALFSCNNSGSSSTETTKTDSTTTDTTTTVAAPATAAPAMVAPFDVAEVTHKVKNYATWRPIFDADSANRQAAGLENIAIGRNMNDSNDIVLAFKADDVAKAMAKGGVISKPDFSLWHVIRFNAESHQKQWVEINHKVKNFDAWLKVYDGEGTAQRANEGMVDVALARGVDDSNMVKLVFDITDLAKAKAAISSDAKKKLMMSAGVEGKPSIEFYQDAK
jgi:hypothetical protein